MLLTNEGKREFLKNKFHQFFDITISNNISSSHIQPVNLSLSLEKINDFLDLEELTKYFNEDYNNVIFTAADDIDKIYQYEYYEGIYFIKLKPFSNTIRMHIVPKKYDASDSQSNNPILFFKDNRQTISDDNFSCTSQYERKENKKNINSYYKKEEKETSNTMYKFDIKKYTKNMKNIQINVGYSYNETNPTNQRIHYTGILDESDENGNKISSDNLTEFNAALMDANLDNIHIFTNMIIQQQISSNQIEWPFFSSNNNNEITLNINKNEFEKDEDVEITGQLSNTEKDEIINFYKIMGFNNEHIINKTFHKTIKYFNDDMYIEENGQYLISNWIEREDN